MRCGVKILAIVLILAFLGTSGSAYVSFGNVKSTDFGTTLEQQKLIDSLIEKYGDPRTNTGPPRFIEPLVTTNVVNDMAVDKVQSFSMDTNKIYFWVFYDNFVKGDQIEMKLAYPVNGVTIASSQQQAGGDFGAASGSIEKPDIGWLPGTYSITVSGKGASTIIIFDVVKGPAVTVPLPYVSPLSTPTYPTQQLIELLPTLTPEEQPVEGLAGVTVSESYPVGFEGMSFNLDGQNSVSLDISAAEQAGATVTTYSDRVEVSQDGSQGVRIIFFIDRYERKNKTITGTAKGAEFETSPLTINVSAGKVAGSVRGVLNSISQPVRVENTITGNITVRTADQFRKIMAQKNLAVAGIAYLMNFHRDKLVSTGMANVTLTVPALWVNQHGGKDSVRIARISDTTGMTELINTVYVGIDTEGNMVFRGDSPNGTSIFGLLTSKATAKKQMENPDIPIQPLQKPAVLTGIGMFGWLAGIMQQNPVVLVAAIVIIGVIAYFGWWKRRIEY